MNQTSFCLNSKFHQTSKIISQQQQLSSPIQQWHIHQQQQLFMNSFQVHQTTTS